MSLLYAYIILGQIYVTSGCYPNNPTCDNPNTPILCDVPRCVCPRGQVIGRDGLRCINLSSCSGEYIKAMYCVCQNIMYRKFIIVICET